MNVDMKGLKALQVAAAGKLVAWHDAAKFCFTNHAGYVPALKAVDAARDAYQAVWDKASSIIAELASDPETDPTWFSAADPNGPVWLRNNAQSNLVALAQGRKDVLRDMAGNFQLGGAVSSSPYSAAAAADAAAKGKLGGNPNTRDGSKQSNTSPPAPTDAGDAGDAGDADAYGMVKKVGIAAALGLGALWIARKVL